MWHGQLLDNYGKPRQLYFDKLTAMTEEQLLTEGEQMIWLSAFASNNPRSDYHWQVDAFYDEVVVKRQKPELYEKAYNAARSSAGY